MPLGLDPQARRHPQATPVPRLRGPLAQRQNWRDGLPGTNAWRKSMTSERVRDASNMHSERTHRVLVGAAFVISSIERSGESNGPEPATCGTSNRRQWKQSLRMGAQNRGADRFLVKRLGRSNAFPGRTMGLNNEPNLLGKWLGPIKGSLCGSGERRRGPWPPARLPGSRAGRRRESATFAPVAPGL